MAAIEELMAGDYIFNLSNELCKVCEINTIGLPYIRVDNLDDPGDFDVLEDFNIKGVPLTYRLLSNCGFTWNSNGWLWCKDKEDKENNYIFIQFKERSDTISSCEFNFLGKVHAVFRNISYFHELQHALKLFKIECEITREK